MKDLETVINIIQQTFNLRVTQQGDSTILNLKQYRYKLRKLC